MREGWTAIRCCKSGFKPGGGHGFMMGSGVPEECPYCDGTRVIWRSPKGRLAKHPGGPFIGSEPAPPQGATQ